MRIKRYVDWLAHHRTVVAVCAVAAWVAAMAMHPLSTIVGFSAIGCATAVEIADSAHRKKLCEHCMASMPLDLPAEAAAKRKWLRMYHFHGHTLSLIDLASVVIGTAASVRLLGAVGIGAVEIVKHFTGTNHRRFHPWCPWCHDDDGPDHPEPETPSPTPPSISPDTLSYV